MAQKLLGFITVTIILIVASFIGKANGNCYVCNSYQHPGCSDISQLKQYIQPCPLSAKACRIIRQTVNGVERLIRQCSEVDSDDLIGCSPGIAPLVRVTHCNCRGDLCNPAPTILPFSIGLVAAFTMIMTIFVGIF